MTGGVAAVWWLIIAVLLFLIEGATVQLLCVWFAVGALITMIFAWLGVPYVGQLVIFLCTSMAAILLGRPFFKKRLNFRKSATNADLVIGQTGVVLEEVNNILQTGRVAANGLEWTARAQLDSDVIPEKSLVVAVRIDGVKLVVEPKKEKQEEKTHAI